ncbi:transcription factor SCREAM2-like [Phragmites australis]|uniref:transcription factor SCREAM2-like n=1 Tax=Phragmites australis TaxID=29695 RepID=UPI002D79409B|nr:transcription factor SCREAM2-like [Phragmites australis]
MSGKEKKEALKEKLQLLRSVTKSNAANKTSILVDASKYIKELEDKVEAESAAASQADSDAMAAMVSVASVELAGDSSSSSSRRGFRINVSMERSRPGLLVSVLEAFEELGLDVLDADVSCADDTAFRLQALGSGQGQQGESVDEQMVRQAVLQAISKCINDGDD